MRPDAIRIHKPAAAEPPRAPAALSLQLDPAALRPIVTEVIAQVLAEFDQLRGAAPNEPLCYDEPTAARMLGIEPHSLRDERLRGGISASRIVGRRVRYTRDDLVTYLSKNRLNVG